MISGTRAAGDLIVESMVALVVQLQDQQPNSHQQLVLVPSVVLNSPRKIMLAEKYKRKNKKYTNSFCLWDL